MSDIDLIDVLRGMSKIDKETESSMEKALSNTLLLLTQQIIERTILPKRAIKPLALLNNDIFFREIIDDYKDNLKDTKKIIKIYESLIKAIAKGIGQESEKKSLIKYLKGKL